MYTLIYLKGMSNLVDGIKVFAVFQHSHLLGRRIRTRHIRDGVELAPIADDQNYDFDYQEARVLKEEVTVNQVGITICTVTCELSIVMLSLKSGHESILPNVVFGQT